jgi:acyl-CoA thioesterase
VSELDAGTAGRGGVSEFDTDTAVRAVAASTFAATVTDRWNALGGRPNGGYVLAMCLRALQHEMAPPDLLAVSAYFLRPATPGPAIVRTDVARVGRRVSTGETRLLQDDREVVRAVASFTDLSQAAGRTLVLNETPKLPPPEESIDVLRGVPAQNAPITGRYEYRMTEIPPWMRGQPSNDPGMSFWIRFKDGRAADPLALVAIVDAGYPAVLEIGEPLSTTLELTVHVRARPAPGWLACRVGTRYVTGGFHEEDFEIWSADGTLLAQSRQLALLA